MGNEHGEDFADAQFEQRLAAYLGDEFSDEQRAAFEAELAADPARAARTRALRATLAALHDVLPADAGWTPLRVSSSRGAPRRVRSFRWLRYAAIVVMAFGAGFGARMMTEGGAASRTAKSLADARTTMEAPAFLREYQRVSQEHAHASAFSRALLTLARSRRS